MFGRVALLWLWNFYITKECETLKVLHYIATQPGFLRREHYDGQLDAGGNIDLTTSKDGNGRLVGHIFQPSPIASKTSDKEHILRMRHKTKAPQFYREQLNLHVKKMRKTGRIRDVSRR